MEAATQADDIDGANSQAWLAGHGAAYGLCLVYQNEPCHFELCPKAARPCTRTPPTTRDGSVIPGSAAGTYAPIIFIVNQRKALVLAAVGGAGVGWLAWKLRRRCVRPARRAAPAITDLLAEHAGRIDFADAWAAPIAEGEGDDPKQWAGAVLDLPPAINRLMRVRDALARRFGLATMTGQDLPPTGFPLLAEGDHEVVLGVDDNHLNFRLGITTRDKRAVFTTTVTIHNRLGACYWALVRLFHPFVVATALGGARL